MTTKVGVMMTKLEMTGTQMIAMFRVQRQSLNNLKLSVFFILQRKRLFHLNRSQSSTIWCVSHGKGKEELSRLSRDKPEEHVYLQNSIL